MSGYLYPRIARHAKQTERWWKELFLTGLWCITEPPMPNSFGQVPQGWLAVQVYTKIANRNNVTLSCSTSCSQRACGDRRPYFPPLLKVKWHIKKRAMALSSEHHLYSQIQKFWIRAEAKILLHITHYFILKPWMLRILSDTFSMPATWSMQIERRH